MSEKIVSMLWDSNNRKQAVEVQLEDGIIRSFGYATNSPVGRTVALLRCMLEAEIEITPGFGYTEQGRR